MHEPSVRLDQLNDSSSSATVGMGVAARVMLGIEDEMGNSDDVILKVTVRERGNGDDSDVARSSSIISCSLLLADTDGFMFEW